MKHIKYISAIVLLIIFSSCSKEISISDITDKEFITFIADNEDPNKGIERIDSIFNTNHSFSTHKKGLLHYNKASYLVSLEEYIPATVNLKKALLLFEEENDKKFIGITHNLMGNVNLFSDNKEEAIKQIKLAVNIFREINDKDNEKVALDALAHAEFKFGNYDKAIDLLKQSMEIRLELKDSSSFATAYNNIAFVLEVKEDFENAEDYYRKAIEINKRINSKSSISLRNLGEYYLAFNKTEKGLNLFIDALDIEKKSGNLLNQEKIYNILIDEIDGESIKNIETQTKYIFNLPQYLKNRDSIKQLIDLQKNEKKIKLLEDQYILLGKEKELLQEKKINKKNRNLFLALFGLSLFAGLFLLQRSKLAVLKANQDKLILEQKVLRSQMNPHFIFNTLGAIQKSLLDNDPLKSASALSKFSKLIRKNFEYIDKTYISLAEEIETLTNYIETQQLRFEDEFEFKINIEPSIEMATLMIPPVLLQPFIENSIEHGIRPLDTEGFLEINIRNAGEFTHFEIIDNGVGLSNKNKDTDREHATDIFLKRLKLRKFGEEKLFSISNRKDTQGTIVNLFLKLHHA